MIQKQNYDAAMEQIAPYLKELPSTAQSLFGAPTYGNMAEDFIVGMPKKHDGGSHNSIYFLRIKLQSGQTAFVVLKAMRGKYGVPADEVYTRAFLDKVSLPHGSLKTPRMAASPSNSYLLMEQIPGIIVGSMPAGRLNYEDKKGIAYALGKLARVNGMAGHTKQEHLIFSPNERETTRLDLEWGLKPEMPMADGIGQFELSVLEDLARNGNHNHSSSGALQANLDSMLIHFRQGFHVMDERIRQNLPELEKVVDDAAMDPRSKVTAAHAVEVGQRIAAEPGRILRDALEWQRANTEYLENHPVNFVPVSWYGLIKKH